MEYSQQLEVFDGANLSQIVMEYSQQLEDYAPTYLFTLFNKFGSWASIGNASAGVGIASNVAVIMEIINLS